MKIERKESKFEPVVITLESQEEVDQMYAFSNHCSFESHQGDVTNTLFDYLESLQENEYSMDKDGVFSKMVNSDY